MNRTTDSATQTSRLFQLLALGFAHPVEEFHHLLLEGGYQQALGATATAVGISANAGSLAPQAFADFEAGYIALFQIGRRGKPLVSLNAGDYPALNDEASRPEFLLRYSDWYRHFGLRTSDGEDANELPDHLVCQLEFVAWLGHLEAGAADDDARLGYQKAQRDFLERHLEPFAMLLAERLQRQEGDPVAGFFHALTVDLAAITEATVWQLAAELEANSPSKEQQDSDRIDAVNLWG